MSNLSSPVPSTTSTLVRVADTRPTIRSSSIARQFPAVGLSYSFVKVNELNSAAPTSPKSEDTALVIEPDYYPSQTARPFTGMSPDMTADEYNEMMLERFLDCVTMDIPFYMGHISQKTLVRKYENLEEFLTQQDPSASVNQVCAKKLKSIITQVGRILIKNMDDEYGRDGHPAVSFVEPSKWSQLQSMEGDVVEDVDGTRPSFHREDSMVAIASVTEKDNPVLWGLVHNPELDVDKLESLESLRVYWRMKDSSLIPMDGKL